MTTSVGIDIGGTKILGIALDPDAPTSLLAEKRVPTPPTTPGLLAAVVEVVQALTQEVGSVGIGIAGLVDRGGVLRVSPNLSHLRGVDLVSELRRQLGDVAITVDNDGTVAAWGEHCAGAARGHPDVVVLTLGTGVGGGFVVDGQVVRGAHGFAAEVGHMVVDPNGPPCPCGRVGCWERYASGHGLARLARDLADAGRLPRARELAGGDALQVKGEHVAAAAREGDDASRELLDTYAGWVALGVGNLITLLDCGMVVISGGVVELGELLFDPLQAKVPAHIMAAADHAPVPVVPAQLGSKAGAIGAAMLGAAAR